MLIGYCRVSTKEQNLDRQVTVLRGAGCTRIFEEKLSGKNLARPELQLALDSLARGDTLVVAEWDRATRSMYDGISIMQQIHAKGAFIKVLDRPVLDLSTPIGQGFLAFLSAMAQDERERINKRANAGRAEAKLRGVKFGRKPKLSAYQRSEALKMLHEGKTTREVGKLFGVDGSTISRMFA